MLGRFGARGGFGRLGLVGGITSGINLSGAVVSSSAAIGTVIGTLSVRGSSGSFTFTLTSNPGGLFSVSGASLEVAAALTPGSDPITIQATNGTQIISAPFTITVTNGAFVPTFFFLGF